MPPPGIATEPRTARSTTKSSCGSSHVWYHLGWCPGYRIIGPKGAAAPAGRLGKVAQTQKAETGTKPHLSPRSLTSCSTTLGHAHRVASVWAKQYYNSARQQVSSLNSVTGWSSVGVYLKCSILVHLLCYQLLPNTQVSNSNHLFLFIPKWAECGSEDQGWAWPDGFVIHCVSVDWPRQLWPVCSFSRTQAAGAGATWEEALIRAMGEEQGCKWEIQGF